MTAPRLCTQGRMAVSGCRKKGVALRGRVYCNGLVQELRPKPNLAQCWLTAHRPAQQRNPLAIHLARNYDHATHDRRQRFLSQAMIVFACPAREPLSPESSDIHADRLIPFMLSHTPLVFTRHVQLPIVKQLVYLPFTAAKDGKLRRTSCSVNPCRSNAANTAPRLRRNDPLSMTHSRCFSAIFVPTGTVRTTAALACPVCSTAIGMSHPLWH